MTTCGVGLLSVIKGHKAHILRNNGSGARVLTRSPARHFISELGNYLRKLNIQPDVRKEQGGRAPFFRRGGHRSTGLKRTATQYLGQYYQCIEWNAMVGIAALASQLPPFISVYYRYNWFSINASKVRINLTCYSLDFSHLQSLRSTKTEN